MSAIFGYYDHITAVAYYRLLDMVSGGGLMKSFAGFQNVVVVRWLFECSWRLSPGISGIPVGKLEVVLDHNYAHLLHGNATIQRPKVYSSVWHARGIAIVVLWYMAKRLDGEHISLLEDFGEGASKNG